jgi:hypothetical protein
LQLSLGLRRLLVLETVLLGAPIDEPVRCELRYSHHHTPQANLSATTQAAQFDHDTALSSEYTVSYRRLRYGHCAS